jgi:hypothetical protein
MINPVLAEMLIRIHEREVADRLRQDRLLALAADPPGRQVSVRRSIGRRLVALGNRLGGSIEDDARWQNGESLTNMQCAEC